MLQGIVTLIGLLNQYTKLHMNLASIIVHAASEMLYNTAGETLGQSRLRPENQDHKNLDNSVKSQGFYYNSKFINFKFFKKDLLFYWNI